MLCRLCLKKTNNSQNIIESELKYAEWTLVEAIYCIFGVRVDINDPHTKYICERCERAIKCIGNYREFFRKNQALLELNLKSKSQELTCQDSNTDKPQTCTTATSPAPLVTSPKAKKRRLTPTDYKSPLMAMSELVNEKITNINESEGNGVNEGPLVSLQEFQVQVCKYCSKIFSTKHQLEIHYNTDHGSFHLKNKLRGESKNFQQSETVLSQIKDPGRVSKNKYRETFSFSKLNYIYPCENSSDAGKIISIDLTEDDDQILPTDNFTPDCPETDTNPVIIEGVLGQELDVEPVNLCQESTKQKDVSTPENHNECTTDRTNCTVQKESNAADKSSHASGGTDIRNWKNNLSETLQMLSQISKSDTMKLWIKTENDDGGGFEEITSMDETNSSEKRKSESLETEDPSKTLSNTLQTETRTEEMMPKSQQTRETDELVHKISSKTSQQSKNAEEEEQETEAKQKKIVSKINVTEMQHMKEHILSTLQKILAIKEKATMNHVSKTHVTETEQSNSDGKMAEAENTIEDTSTAASVTQKGDASENPQEETVTSDESEEESTENNWKEEASDIDEDVVAAEKMIYVSIDDICMSEADQDTNSKSSEHESEAIKKEQQDQTLTLEHPITPNANERNEWKKNISASLMKLQLIKTTELLGKSTGLQLESKHNTLNDSSEDECVVDEDENTETSEDNMEEDTEEGTNEQISDAEESATTSINEQLTSLNGEKLVVSLERCPIELDRNSETSEVTQCVYLERNQVASIEKWKNAVPETLLKLQKINQNELLKQKMGKAEAVIITEQNENDFKSYFITKKPIRVNESYLLADDETILKTLNNQHSWLNLKDFHVSVRQCNIPKEIRQSIIADRNEWKESISTLLPIWKELKENNTIKQKMKLANVVQSQDVDRSSLKEEKRNTFTSGAETSDTRDVTHEPEFVSIRTDENEGYELPNAILTDSEGNSSDPFSDVADFNASSDESAESSDHEAFFETVSLCDSEVTNKIKQQLHLKDFHISLERIQIPTNFIGKTVGVKNWKTNISDTLLKLRSIKVDVLEKDKSKVADVRPVVEQSKGIIKTPTTDGICEMVVNPNFFESASEIINIDDTVTEIDNPSQNTQEKIDSPINVKQNNILNPSLTLDVEVNPIRTEDTMQRQTIEIIASDDMEKDLHLTDCIIETIDIGPHQTEDTIQDTATIPAKINPIRQDSTEMVAPNTNLEDKYEDQSEPLGDILEQASIWIQQNPEDGKNYNLVQIEDLVQKQQVEPMSNEEGQVSTEIVIHETYEDLVASLEIEGVSVQETTGNMQDSEIDTLVTDEVAQSEETDSLELEHEVDNEAECLETESQTQLEQPYPLKQQAEDILEHKGIEDQQKTIKISSIQTENKRQDANTLLINKSEKESKKKKHLAKVDVKSETQTDSPKMKQSDTLKPMDPRKNVYKSNGKKKTKKEKLHVPTCCHMNRPDIKLKAGERVPSASLVVDQNLFQNTDTQEIKAQCSKSDAKPSKQRKKHITLMNEADRLTRDVEQLTKYLNILKLMEDNQKSLSSSNSKQPSSAHCDDTVKKTFDKQQEVGGQLETTNKEEILAEARTTDSTQENTSSPKINQITTSPLKDHDGEEKNSNNATNEKGAEEIRIWKGHLSSTLSKIRQIQGSNLFNSKFNAKILLNKEDEKDDVTKTQ